MGESYYLRELAFAYEAFGGAPMPAVLVAEPTNPFDRSAVAVLGIVNGVGYLIGHLPREVAAAMQPIVASFESRQIDPLIEVTVSPFVTKDGRNMLTVEVLQGV